MRAAEAGFEPSGQVLVRQDGVEIHRRLGRAHVLSARRDAGMEVGQRLAVIEPFGLGHEAFEKRQHPVGAVDEAFQGRAPVGGALCAVFVEPGLGARGVVGRRQPEQGQEIAALEMRAFLLELSTPLRIDQRRNRIKKLAEGIAMRRHTLRLDEHRPAGAETAQGVVEAGGDGDEFGWSRAIEVGPAEARGALERAVLVEDDARRDERGPGQKIGEALGSCGDIRRGSA